ncbi:Proteasome-substrate-size regulator, mid region [Popillia japonica]|uniref:Proteasome-substrate-size regulator, mid region n=1 Tax=Popillia japonica TaxID=7064 RepID=A0AAW1N0J7_POPJA
MDNPESNERFKVLGFIPQKENVYNKLLPYADKLDQESTKLFLDIKTNLIKSVLAREMRPGCALWTSRLNKYMKIYGLKFSKDDHICLIRLYYDLLTQPNLEPTRINKFAATLSFLLKKDYLLSQDDLQLDWKPLYDLCTRLVQQSKNDIGMYRYSSGLETALENLIRCARIYFPVTATQEILDEFRPQLCPYSNSEIASAIEYLEIFLPIVVKPEEADLGYKLWFEELMNLWEVCHNANIWESHLATLMARLAKYNIGYINWEPYIPIMFVRFLRTLHLPVGYKQKQSSKMYKIDIHAMTMWIVCTFGGGNDTAFIHLEKFMQTLESYCHPANTGRWTPKIREFLKKISFYFVQRVHYERYRTPSWDYRANPDYILTDAEIDRFVAILKPCIEQAIFMKQGVQDIVLTLNYLACLRPNILIPITLDKLYSSMDSLTEPHKLTSSIVCVTAVSRYMVQGKRNGFPEGPTNVLPLLNALLPGRAYYLIFMWIESNSLEFTRMELSDNNFSDVKMQYDYFCIRPEETVQFCYESGYGIEYFW